MRLHVLLGSTALLWLAVSPLALRAQFQDPTSDELKMTADPKAPGAAAVYLDIREIANDPDHYQRFYVRIKVLAEKGKELATVEVPYLQGDERIAEIQGRTIHADGTVIPLTVKPEDLLIVKRGEAEVERKVFTLPSVEVGSILEYRYELQYPDDEYVAPHWEIQRDYFVRREHYEFTPAERFLPNGFTRGSGPHLTDSKGNNVSNLLVWTHVPPGASVQRVPATGKFSIDLTDVPPIPSEEWMPPIARYRYRVFFYYKYAANGADFWVSESKLWSKDVDRFAEPSSVIKDAINGLIAPGDSELDKAKKLYAAVQSLDNTDYTRRKSETERKQLKIKGVRRAEDTWTQKSGSSEDIAMLYLAMLRAAGLTAYAVKVVDRDRGIFDPSWLDFDQLNSTLIVLATQGSQIVLDPGEKMCPFEMLSWQHSYASGVAQTPQGPSFTTTPEQLYTSNATLYIGDLTLDAQGRISGQLRVVMTGQEALLWRQAALRNDEAELEQQFNSELENIVPEGAEAQIGHFEALDNPNENLVAVGQMKGALGTATAKRLVLPGFFFETRRHVPFVAEATRLVPVDMHSGSRVSEQVTYHLPAGMTVEGAPSDANISWPGHALLVVKSLTQPGQITIAQTLSNAFTIAEPEEYQDLRGFYQKVAEADQAQLVLTIAPAATAVSSAEAH